MPLPNTFRATTRTDIMRQTNTSRGFTLLEMMVSMALGLLVVGGATLLYKQSVDTTWMTSQKSEMQQDFRAVSNLMERDIGMAGSGSLGQQGLGASSVASTTLWLWCSHSAGSNVRNKIGKQIRRYDGQTIQQVCVPGRVQHW